MKHIDITTPVNGLASVMVTQSSNNFGDQTLDLKVLVEKNETTQYVTVKSTVNHEGQWFDGSIQIKNWAIQSMQMLFLDWTNNFITVNRFAEFYLISVDAAHVVINEGREIHEAHVKRIGR